MKKYLLEELLISLIYWLYLLFVCLCRCDNNVIYDFLAQSDVYTVFVQLCYRTAELQMQFRDSKWKLF